MTQADRVHSTPPLNTSVSLSRRHMLAGVAVTTALPTAAIAATTAEPDPIFAAIAASREAQNEADRPVCGGCRTEQGGQGEIRLWQTALR